MYTLGLFLQILLWNSNFFCHSNAQFTGFYQKDQYEYLQRWSQIQRNSYQETLPSQLPISCKSIASSRLQNYVNFPTIYLNGTFDALSFQNICGSTNVCVLTKYSSLNMNGNLNVAALKILGNVYWNESSQTQSDQWLCAGYVAVEQNGIFKLSMDSNSKRSYIYIKNNGAVHPTLRTRAFGGFNVDLTIKGPTIDVSGRTMKRTWSLLFKKVLVGSNQIKLIHNPKDMGWQIGDRIVIAPTSKMSRGYAESFKIVLINTLDNTIILDKNVTQKVFNANFLHNGTSNHPVALMSAEVINLSRNVIITGDDFNHISCDPNLVGAINSLGCSCNRAINRTVCTMGLHTMMAGKGVMKMQYSRIEKCGQRGIFSKYCLHFHKMGASPESIFKGNAIENSQQRGIIIHDTHLTTVEENVLNDVRGAGIYVQDGNELYNKIKYNVVICPTPKDDPTFGGCTIPGTDNGQADGTLNQAGLWSVGRTNDMIGNRFVNSFNGMFYDFSGSVVGTNPLNSIMGRIEGNTFHGHGRFGTYVLHYNPRDKCIGKLSNDGFPATFCSAFNSTGLDNGFPVVISNNVDYDNLFVGGYSYGDVQYQGHIAVNNNNNVYWKESKSFADGCSAHISNSYYVDGNIALPDSAAFIIENTIFTGLTNLETNHHCNEGPTGFLCMPTYIFSNTSFKAMSSKEWVMFQVHANSFGSMLVLPPSEADNPRGSGGFFPPTFNSLVSSYYSYLLNFENSTCQRSRDINNAWPGVPKAIMNIRYAGGIFCKKPLRSLKIYTRGLSYATANNMTLEVWRGPKLIASFVSKFHQIGQDLPLNLKRFQPKQGYAFPVIADANYEHRIYMNNYKGVVKYPDGNLPTDWIVEFSDPVFGNRWTPDKIILTVKGQNCNKKLVTSQHDRRWVWAASTDYPSPQAWGRGACNSVYPDMPAISCPTVPVPISPLSCNHKCSKTCSNGYCDCGSEQCVCNPGYSGPDCSVNVCDNARCGSHGKCIATYLGGDLLPSQGTCACDQGWSGPNCDQNPCKGVTCSDRGYCQAKGDTDRQCICDPAYTGYNCEKVKQETCAICPANFMTGCGYGKLLDQKMFTCRAGTGPNVGCFYPPTYVNPQTLLNACCYDNCEKCDLIRCPPAINDCHLSSACNPLDGKCGAQIKRSDGAPCNSIPGGICQQGICKQSAPTAVPSSSPSSYVPMHTLLGDYKDRNFPRALSKRFTGVTFTPDTCSAISKANSYKYFGLQYGGECWADNNLTSAKLYGPAIATMVCTANRLYKCGGPLINTLYEVVGSFVPTSLPSISPSISNGIANDVRTCSPTTSTPTSVPNSVVVPLLPVAFISDSWPSLDPTITPTITLTATPTITSTTLPTITLTATPTITSTMIPEITLTATPTITSTMTPEITLTATPTITSTISLTSTSTTAPTITTTVTPTITTTTASTTTPTIASIKSYSFSYLGDYKDRNFPRALSKRFTGVTYTPDTCSAISKASSYKYFGLQYGGECWAGNNLTSAKLYGPAIATMVCTANRLYKCGGPFLNSLYEVVNVVI